MAMNENENVDRVMQIADLLYEHYREVASGETRGSGGVFYADGAGTLNAVVVDVTILEDLARALGKPVLGRTRRDRITS
jgi:hypothetical protein